MKKRVFVLFFSIVFSLIIYAQEVEKLGEIKGIVAVHGIAGSPGTPNEIAVNEVENKIKIVNKTSDYYDLNTLKGIKKTEYRETYTKNSSIIERNRYRLFRYH